MKYDYLLFDVDGTVLSFEAAEKAALSKIYREFFGAALSDNDIKTYSGINAVYWQKLERGEIEKARLLVQRFEDFFAVMGVSADAAAFNARYQSELGETIVFCDDSINILKSLKGKCALAAVSNGTQEAQRRKLSKSGLDKVFDYIFISDEVGIEKPNRGFFDAVFREMGIADTSKALIIGDSRTSDIQGGINAGIDTCLYNPEGKPGKIQPVYEIRDLHEVVGIING